jgi:hypothetical protein
LLGLVSTLAAADWDASFTVERIGATSSRCSAAQLVLKSWTGE